jgi:CRISPR system Cascade subunit CasA
MPSFNLVTEKWIPCLTADGPAEFSLRDTLTQAHDIKEISDDSPLVTIALHRLLLAILHRNFGPADFDEWKELWRAGQWDAAKLNDYFAQWQHRFELFDKERPFYQVPRMTKAVVVKKGKAKNEEIIIEEVEILPISTLIQEAAAATNATLFDHRIDAYPDVLHSSKVARYLIARQGYSISEGSGYAESVGANGYTILVKGKNLFETLALNLVPYNEETPIPHQIEKDISKDKPIWEQDYPLHQHANENGEAHPLGYLDYLTWQGRKIHLVSDKESDSVSWCQRVKNLKLNTYANFFDPLKSYEENDKKGWLARRINKEKALWRDCHSLLADAEPLNASKSKRPEVFSHLANIAAALRHKQIVADNKYTFAVFGMNNKNGKASFDLWVRELLPLPLSYLTNSGLMTKLHKAIEVAEQVEGGSSTKGLRASLRRLALTLVGDKEWGKLAKSFGAEDRYWSSLSTPFKQLLEDLATDVQEDEDGEVRFGEIVLPQWAKFVTEQAEDALQHAINSLRGTARELKAASFAEAEFNKQIGIVKKKFPNLFPKGEKQ